MRLVVRLAVLPVVGALAFSGCGEDSGPSTASSLPESGASTSAAVVNLTLGRATPLGAQTVTSVEDILAAPDGFIGQNVELLGRLVQSLSATSLLFTDGTGAIPLDFDTAPPAPPLNELIQAVGTVTPGTGDFAVRVQVLSWSAQPPFNCDDLEDIRARFSEPGFVAGDVVGLYLAYRGLPPGEKKLEVDWGDGRVDAAEVGEGRQRDDGRFDLDGVVGHEYQGLNGTEEKSVRASLYVEGRDGSCSRVRTVTVSPGSGPGFAAGGNLRLSFNDPVPSGGFFSVSATVRNPTSRAIDANLVFNTPGRSSIRTLGAGCQKLSDEVVECRVEGIGPNGSGDTFVQYNVPVVSAPTSIRGSVTLVSRDFSPVANYSTTVEP